MSHAKWSGEGVGKQQEAYSRRIPKRQLYGLSIQPDLCHIVLYVGHDRQPSGPLKSEKLNVLRTSKMVGSYS